MIYCGDGISDVILGSYNSLKLKTSQDLEELLYSENNPGPVEKISYMGDVIYVIVFCMVKGSICTSTGSIGLFQG